MRVKELIEHLQCFDPELFVEFEYWDSDEGHLIDDVDDVRLIPQRIKSSTNLKTKKVTEYTIPATVRLG